MSTRCFGLPRAAVSLTVEAFPQTPTDKERSALPLGMEVDVALCATMPLGKDAIVAANDLEQCGRCGGYINSRCDFDYRLWRCNLCGKDNVRRQDMRPSAFVVKERTQTGEHGAVDTYEVVLGARPLLLQPGVVKVHPPLAVEGARVVALVDVSGSRAYMERTRAALLDAVDELQPGTLFSLVTFSDTVGIYQLGRQRRQSRRQFAHVVHIPLQDPAE